MASVFKNPLTTPVGLRLSTAVSHGQSAIDYPLVMEMCDLINDTDHGPKDAKSAFKKIIFANKDMGQVLQSLAILDMCIKNCQKRFHKHIITKDFVVEIAKLAQSSKTSHNAVREKCLLLIQSWADTYRGKEDMGVAAEIYDQLKTSGVEFPAVNLDDMVPVRTPPSRQTSVPSTQQTQQNLPFSQPSASYPRQPQPVQQPRHPQPSFPFQPQQRPYAPQQQAASSAPRALTSDQLAKILSEADVVETNIQVLSDLMLNSVPGQDKQEDIDFMQNLKDTIQKMQTRVMDLLNLPNTEEITARLLQLNDNINNVFTRHERFVRQTQAASNPSSSQRPIHIPEEPTSDTGISYPTLSASSPDPQVDNTPDPQFTQPSTQLAAPPVPAPAPATQVPTTASATQVPTTASATQVPTTASATQVPTTAPVPTPAPDPISELLLLDFGSSSSGVDNTPIIPTASQPAAPSADTDTTVDEFDIFAKSRQNIYATEYDTTSYSDATQQSSASLSQAMHPRSMSPEDAHGLHEWLAASNLTTEPPATTQTTSEEFDKFLEARASKSTKPKKGKDKLDSAEDMFSL